MKHFAVVALLLYILGIIFGIYLPDDIMLFMLCLLLASTALFIKFRKPKLCALVLFGFFGFFMVTNSLGCKNRLIEAEAKTDSQASITAVVEAVSDTKSGQAAYLRVKSMELGSSSYKASLKLYMTYTKEKLRPGDMVEIYGRLSALDGARNPGAFNEFLYLRARKVDYRLFPQSITVTGHVFRLSSVLDGLSKKCENVLDRLYDDNQAGLAKAILLGKLQDISRDDRQLYKEMGIYHILSVSGMHITLIAILVEAMFSIILPRRGSLVLTLFLVALYCVFVGAGIAVVRALTMYSVFALSVFLRRDRDHLTTISAAAFILLVYEPLYLFDMGFLYSFAAVTGIALFTKPVERCFMEVAEKFPKTARFLRLKMIRTYLPACISATFAIFPITLYYYGTVSFLSVFANLIVVPSVTLLMIMSISSLVLGFFLSGAAAIFAAAASLLFTLYDFVGLVITHIPFSDLNWGRPFWLTICCYYVLLFMFAYVFSGNRMHRLLKTRVLPASALLFAVVCAGFSLAPKGFRVTMLDVGQGDCTVLEYNGFTAVIDGGGTYNAANGSTGEHVLMPYLRYRGIDSVDCVFVSHIDADHAVGIAELLEGFYVKNIYIGESSSTEKALLERLLTAAADNNVRLHYLKAGDVVQMDKLLFSCLYPEKGNAEKDENDQSLVLKVSFGAVDFLFAGDISASVENMLISEKANELDCEIMKLSHHGSKYSNSEEFLSIISPELVFAGAGRNNPYGHPSAEVIERLEKLGIAEFNTAKNGAVTITTDGKNIYVKVMVDTKTQ